ncbi:hypothetical protein FACS1894120_1510 [Clostridia bacterium]|nr:hypothetical protein FACS1894120_1510 [Clostridia bacterium]
MLYFIPILAVAAIVAPLVWSLNRAKKGVKINRRKMVLINAVSFIVCMAATAVVMPLGVFAESGAAVAAEAASSGLAQGLKYIGAALATGAATIGTGIAVGGAAPAAIGATGENDKNFAKAIVFVALGEGVAIYGLLVSILILNS